MTRQPSKSEWAVADEFWELMQSIDPAKAKIIVTNLIASTPKTLEQARNVLRDASMLKE